MTTAFHTPNCVSHASFHKGKPCRAEIVSAPTTMRSACRLSLGLGWGRGWLDPSAFIVNNRIVLRAGKSGKSVLSGKTRWKMKCIDSARQMEKSISNYCDSTKGKEGGK
ncbi:hypothetical protein AVEN_65107-1 [Araneus ventricosus]|uniref:Uncharacterized protein n=1 Tax=Araneus ventricosus TaxID=182803 RepID=A0A4Y2T8T4_ARAVE|nr:hypothetical protein AVEN_65107-1 [Araneus ventricosus]